MLLLLSIIIFFAKSSSISEKLINLEELKEKGLVSIKEFRKYREDILSSTFSGKKVVNKKGPYTDLVWSDDFKTLDLKKWKHEITMSGGGNWEFEYYLNNRSNSFVEDGVLHIKPTLTADTIGEDKVVNGGDMNIWGAQPADVCTSNFEWGCERSSNGANIINPIQSARVRTAESFSFKYGKIEVNASLPKGDWIWPAIWLLPKDQQYGLWPASGEIDIMESRGNSDYSAHGVNYASSTLHWGPFYPLDAYNLTHGEIKAPSGDFSDGFHIFGMEWTEDRITTYLDTIDNPILVVDFDEDGLFKKGGYDKLGINNPWKSGEKNAPFDQEFYIVMNVAVGGTNSYFPDGVGGKPWKNDSPTAALDFWNAKDQWYKTWKDGVPEMRIDSVKIYQ